MVSPANFFAVIEKNCSDQQTSGSNAHPNRWANPKNAVFYFKVFWQKGKWKNGHNVCTFCALLLCDNNMWRTSEWNFILNKNRDDEPHCNKYFSRKNKIAD